MSALEPTFGEVSHLLSRRMDQLVEVLGLTGHRQGTIFSAHSLGRSTRHIGSLQIYIGGNRSGRWREYAGEDDEAGDALDLVAYVQLGRPAHNPAEKRDAFRWACRWLGLADVGRLGEAGGEKMRRLRAEVARRTAQADADLAVETERKRRGAKAMWLSALPMAAPGEDAEPSPAWRYLTGETWPQRGVPLGQMGRLPSAVRWAPKARHTETDREVPAITCGIFMPGGQLVGCHRTFLEPDGSDKLRTPHPSKKIWPHGWKGGVVPISRGAGDLDLKSAIAKGVKHELCIAEGLEDALTIAVLQPTWRVWMACTQGNFAQIAVPACASAVIVARDNDTNPKTRKAVAASIDALRVKAAAAGVELYESRAILPAKDFNDMIRPKRPARKELIAFVNDGLDHGVGPAILTFREAEGRA